MFSATYATGGVVFSWGRPGLLMENVTVSRHSGPTFGIATNLASAAHSLLPQGPSAVDGSWVKRSPAPLAILPHAHNLQVDTEARCRARPLCQSSNTNIQAHPDIHDESQSVAHSPDTIFCAGPPSFITQVWGVLICPGRSDAIGNP